MKLRLEERLVDGRTVLGYHTFSDSNLQKLFGTNYKPLDRDSELLRMRREVILANHIDNDIDLESDTFDMAKWETFPKEEFPIYNHGCRTLKKFIEKAAAEFSDDLIEKLEAYYTHPNLDGEILPYSRIIMYDGWVRYPYQSEEVQPGVPPQGDVFVLDTETFVRGFPTKYSDPEAKRYKDGVYRFDAPVIATAADNEANYVWMHKNLINGNHEDEWFVSLVPLEERDCIVLAFNSAYDISKIENTYSLEETKIKWMDLMSMHTSRRGFSDDQMKEAGAIRAKTGKGGYLPRWVTEGSKSNLKDSYNLYCGNTYGFLKDEDKKIRDFFVDMGSISELMENWEQMITYSVNDATYTFRQSKRVIPDYLDAHGINSTIALHPIMADSRFHVDGQMWEDFIEHSEDLYFSMMDEQKDIFDRIADGIYEDYSEGYLTQEEIDVDPWLSNLDWESKGKLKTKKTKYYTAIDMDKNILFDDIELPSGTLVRDLTSQWQLEHPYIHKLKYKFTDIVQYESEGYGIPRWYYPRVKDGTLDVTVRGRLCHYLLRLNYLGKPLEFVKGEGWQNTDGEKPVHKKGLGVNVGYILTQDQVKYYEKGHFTSNGQDKYLARLFEISSSTSFWTSTRKRGLSAYHHNGVMSGSYIPHQTCSQRSGSRLWSVVPSPSTKKIGSDFKNMIRVRPGYKFLGSDYDSQEGFIFSILGDSRTGFFNSNPYSHSCSTGSKDYDPPTDFHSVVARASGIPRNDAKIVG